ETMRAWLLLGAACACLCVAAVTEDKLRSSQSDSGTWLMHGKNYSAWRYSDLTQIQAGNVAKLAPRWIFQTGAGPLENTPLVFDGLMFATGSATRGLSLALLSGPSR